MSPLEKAHVPEIKTQHNQNFFKTHTQMNFPGGPVVGNPPANARDMDLIPGPGRAHMPWDNQAWAPQLLKPMHMEPMLCNKRRHHSEMPTHCNKRVAPAFPNCRESVHSNKTQPPQKDRVNSSLFL